MKVEQRIWTATSDWSIISDASISAQANLVFVFGSRESLEKADRYEEIRSFYPNATIISGTTAGEIIGDEVYDESCTVTALHFEKTSLAFASINAESCSDSQTLGTTLMQKIPHANLKHVFVLSDGQEINGSELVKGLYKELPEGISITGGLAGDATRFERTLVGLNEAPSSGNIVITGFYGDHLQVGHGSMGGWDSFGAQRRITRAKGNVLYELDDQPALDLYKTYLGDQAEGLPGTALLFPLSIQLEGSKEPIVRTVLSIDEDKGSMTFAGDVPQGAYARLMKANMDRLVDAASNAASDCFHTLDDNQVDLAILISCVGRKLVLDQRVEEEVENVKEVLGDGAHYTGFYSYGEISPFTQNTRCELHNQTMTITTFTEQ